jgi:hypothetical protein
MFKPQGPSFQERMAQANAQQELMQKSADLFVKMKPLLEAELNNRCASRQTIVVNAPIQNLTERCAKSQTGAMFHQGNEVIPMGTRMVFDGMELETLFFKSEDGSKEYAIHLGENVVVGKQQVVRNSGYIGLLTKTDIFDQVKKSILGE